MASLKSVYSEHCFISGWYLPDAKGRLRPAKLEKCPHSYRLGGVCKISSKGWRIRKTGPYRALKLALCKTHALCFTIYPLGMFPHSRHSFLDEPAMVRCLEDGALNRKWPILSSPQTPTFKTQKRHILMWSKLIGVDELLSDADRQIASITIEIPALLLRDGAQNIRAGPTYYGRARIVMGILKDLGGVKVSRLLHRGHTLKLWGEPCIDERDQIPLVYFNTDPPRPPNLSSP